MKATSSVHRSLTRHLLLGFGTVVTLGCFVFGWAMFTEISGAVIAPGKLVVDSNVKKVQHPTGGIVGDLRVRDGDQVKKGDVVVRLDQTQARASLAIVTKALDELAARRARNEAERDGGDGIVFPVQLRDRLDDPDVAQVVRNEQKLFEVRHSARQGQKAQLIEQIEQIEQQIQGSAEQEAAKSNEVDWVQQELAGIRVLWRQSLVPFSRVTMLERDSSRLQGERGLLMATMAQARGRIAETRLKILQIDEDLRAEVGKELAEIRAKTSELVEKHVAAEDQLRHTDLVAPQDGKIFQRAVHTVGGVIQPGEVVMLVVPVSDTLIVEIKVPPQDVDQLRLGQRAVVRFSSFNRRTTPELNGEVIEIGADVTQDEKRNESYYAVRIGIPDGELERLDGLQPLAGMPVETFIGTSQRTVVSYLLKPMLEQIERTFRGR